MYKKNNFIRADTAIKLGISHELFRLWFNGVVISISTYNKVQGSLKKYKLL